MKKLLLVLLLIIISSQVVANDLTLTKTTLGKLKLDKRISLSQVQNVFKDYKVVHEIAFGDSPDFHKISVINDSGETLFYTMSYIMNDVKETDEEYLVDLLIIQSSIIQDEHGVRVGDRVSDVLKKRQDSLSLVSGHFNNAVGAQSIYYQVTVIPTKEEIEKGLDFYNPESVTMEMILKANPKIESISWPQASWD